MKRSMKMVEVNLLPDIKQEVLAARQMRDRVATWSIIISGGFVTVTIVLLMVVAIVQSIIIGSQDKQITNDFNKYKNYQGINSLLTIQKQLSRLDAIHKKKTVTSRTFSLITQVITKYKLDVTISKIDVDPHKKNLIIDAFSSTGYVELERLMKTLNNAQVTYINNSKLEEINNQSQTNADEATKQLDSEIKNGQYDYLLRDQKASLLSDPSLGQNSEGKQVLTFKIGLAMHDKFFSNHEKTAIIQGSTYKDVTDSLLSVPPELFGSLKEEDKQNKQAGDKK